MSLSEVEFAYFLVPLLLVYWTVPRRASVQNLLLLAASYLFYATWSLRLLPLLIGTTAIDYALGLYLGVRPAPEEADTSSGAHALRIRRRAAFLLSLGVNLGVLAYFKYAGFFAAELAALLTRLQVEVSANQLQFALPLGLSFYTLQRLDYMISVYFGRVAPCRSPIEFALYVAFFPQIISGPISRAASLLPQLALPRRLDPARIAAGAGYLLVGFALKAFLAPFFGAAVDPVFARPAAYTVAAHWVALFAYAAQIFADFAGYSMLAIGSAKLVSIDLPENFNYPFLSQSLPDFWRRWHITLNQWLFEHLYTPLTTSRGWFRGRLATAMILVFVASGVWHGARTTFLVWGILHGLGMVAHLKWDEFYRQRCRHNPALIRIRKSTGYALAAWALTQAFFVATLVPFRAESADAALTFARGLFASTGARPPQVDIGFLFGAAALVAYHLLEIPGPRALRDRFFALPAPVRGVVYGGVIVVLALFTPQGSSTFIYRQF